MNLSEEQILRLEHRLEVAVLFAALATIPLTFAWARGLEGGWVLAAIGWSGVFSPWST